MKATDDEVLAAVGGEMCPEQAEKLRIIHSHMDGLDLCKANLMLLILSTAEKYISEINLVSSWTYRSLCNRCNLRNRCKYVCFPVFKAPLCRCCNGLCRCRTWIRRFLPESATLILQ